MSATPDNPKAPPPSPDGNKIPLRWLVLATVALMLGMIAGGLTMLSADDLPAAVLAGGACAAAAFAWLADNVS